MKIIHSSRDGFVKDFDRTTGFVFAEAKQEACGFTTNELKEVVPLLLMERALTHVSLLKAGRKARPWKAIPVLNFDPSKLYGRMNKSR